MKEFIPPFLLGQIFMRNHVQVYAPGDIFSLYKNCRHMFTTGSQLLTNSSLKNFVLAETVMVECTLRYHTNLVICNDDTTQKSFAKDPTQVEVHFVKFESSMRDFAVDYDRKKGLAQNIIGTLMNRVELESWTIADLDGFMKGNPPVI